MNHIETWEEFLKRKSRVVPSPVDWAQRKENWLTALNSLYGAIKEWLAPELKSESLFLSEAPTMLREEYLGAYEASMMTIRIGDGSVSLIPRGTLIMGSTGRVDMRGPSGQVMLLRDKDDHWQFALREADNITYTELTSTAFKEWLQKLM